jgi:hypothetical protein
MAAQLRRSGKRQLLLAILSRNQTRYEMLSLLEERRVDALDDGFGPGPDTDERRSAR